MIIKNEDFSAPFPIKINIFFEEIKTEETTTTTLIKQIKNDSKELKIQKPINKKPLWLIPIFLIIALIIFLLYQKGKTPKKTFKSFINKKL